MNSRKSCRISKCKLNSSKTYGRKLLEGEGGGGGEGSTDFWQTESLSQIKILISEMVYDNWRVLAVNREINSTYYGRSALCDLGYVKSAEPSLRDYL